MSMIYKFIKQAKFSYFAGYVMDFPESVKLLISFGFILRFNRRAYDIC